MGEFSDGIERIGSERLNRLVGMDLNLLVPLMALLQEKSVTKAATRIGLSQPAMSHVLKRCRHVFNDDLLIRNKGETTLTRRGRQLLAPLGDILLQVSSSMLDYPQFRPDRDVRTVSISMTTTTMLVLLPSLQKLLRTQAPNVVLRVVSGAGSTQELFEDDIDLVLLADSVSTTYPRARLYTDEWVVVASETNARVADGVLLHHLSELPHIVYETQHARILPYATMDELGMARNICMRVADFLVIPHLVQNSECMAFVQQRVAKRLCSELKVRMFPVPFDTQPLGIDAVWNPRLANDPLKTWFTEQLELAVEQMG